MLFCSTPLSSFVRSTIQVTHCDCDWSSRLEARKKTQVLTHCWIRRVEEISSPSPVSGPSGWCRWRWQEERKRKVLPWRDWMKLRPKCRLGAGLNALYEALGSIPHIWKYRGAVANVYYVWLLIQSGKTEDLRGNNLLYVPGRMEMTKSSCPPEWSKTTTFLTFYQGHGMQQSRFGGNLLGDFQFPYHWIWRRQWSISQSKWMTGLLSFDDRATQLQQRTRGRGGLPRSLLAMFLWPFATYSETEVHYRLSSYCPLLRVLSWMKKGIDFFATWTIKAYQRSDRWKMIRRTIDKNDDKQPLIEHLNDNLLLQ